MDFSSRPRKVQAAACRPADLEASGQRAWPAPRSPRVRGRLSPAAYAFPFSAATGASVEARSPRVAFRTDQSPRQSAVEVLSNDGDQGALPRTRTASGGGRRPRRSFPRPGPGRLADRRHDEPREAFPTKRWTPISATGSRGCRLRRPQVGLSQRQRPFSRILRKVPMDGSRLVAPQATRPAPDRKVPAGRERPIPPFPRGRMPNANLNLQAPRARGETRKFPAAQDDARNAARERRPKGRAGPCSTASTANNANELALRNAVNARHGRRRALCYRRSLVWMRRQSVLRKSIDAPSGRQPASRRRAGGRLAA